MERRAEEAQLAKEARNVPAKDDSDGSFNSPRNRNVTNRPPDQPSSAEEEHGQNGEDWAGEMAADDHGDATMEEQVESEEDYDYGRDGYPKEMAAERVMLDKLKTKFKQELQGGASCYA